MNNDVITDKEEIKILSRYRLEKQHEEYMYTYLNNGNTYIEYLLLGNTVMKITPKQQEVLSKLTFT